jgi:hypothetical protein
MAMGAMRLCVARVCCVVALLALSVCCAFGWACSTAKEVPAIARGELVPGEPAHADLDGDGGLEEILVDAADCSLYIGDGPLSYRNRAKWRVFQAVLGDTDHNGLTEVVTLLDSAEGRHLGLFAYFGGEYRERLVTQEIIPSPLAIEITDHGEVILVQPPTSGETAAERTLLRWNGFGFTRINDWL